MKSNSMSKHRSPDGMADVVRPRAETYSTTFHQWLTSGVSAMRTFPAICVHMWSVSRVSRHSSNGRAGQMSTTRTELLLLRGRFCGGLDFRATRAIFHPLRVTAPLLDRR